MRCFASSIHLFARSSEIPPNFTNLAGLQRASASKSPIPAPINFRAHFAPEMKELAALASEGFVEDRSDLIEVTPLGRLFIRNVALRETLHREDEQNTMAYTKGAPEMMLPLCTRMWGEDGEVEMTDAERQRIMRELPSRQARVPKAAER